MTQRFYVAGKMTGETDNGFPAIDAASAYIRALGHEVVSPAEIDRSLGFNESTALTPAERKDVLRRDYFELVSCDAIALLPSWAGSAGAQAERRVAEECGLDVYHVVPWVSLKVETPALLVGLAGYAQSGKDTVAGMMGYAASFQRVAFADALKAVAYNTSQRLRRSVKDVGWEIAKRDPGGRLLLQNLGVAVREHVDPDAWVNAAMRSVLPGGRYVFSDVRFPNEHAVIKARGGFVVRVERPGTGPANQHASETALDGHEFDAILRNTGTLDQLRSRVNTMLQTLPVRTV